MKQEIENAAREYAIHHSAAPDKCTPDWIIADFKAGVKWAMERFAISDALVKAVGGSLPSVDEAGVMAVKISEKLEDKLTAQEQAFFIAGFCECVKWLASNDR